MAAVPNMIFVLILLLLLLLPPLLIPYQITDHNVFLVAFEFRVQFHYFVLLDSLLVCIVTEFVFSFINSFVVGGGSIH